MWQPLRARSEFFMTSRSSMLDRASITISSQRGTSRIERRFNQGTPQDPRFQTQELSMKLSAALTIIALLASSAAIAQHEPGNPSGSYNSAPQAAQAAPAPQTGATAN